LTEQIPARDLVFYRIIRGAEPVLDDFRSAQALGKPLRNRKLIRQWSRGISVYDDLNHAIGQVRLYQFKLGHRIVMLRIPASAAIECEQWTTDLHHYTLYGEPKQLLRLVVGTPILIEKG
jgi:hypothetical protein